MIKKYIDTCIRLRWLKFIDKDINSYMKLKRKLEHKRAALYIFVEKYNELYPQNAIEIRER